MRLEWRSRSDGDDVVIAVDDRNNEVLRVWVADPEILTDFLNDMEAISSLDDVKGTEPAPQNWGDLVLARSDEGDVLDIDPQLYWEGVSFWFRTRGADPHTWRKHS